MRRVCGVVIVGMWLGLLSGCECGLDEYEEGPGGASDLGGPAWDSSDGSPTVEADLFDCPGLVFDSGACRRLSSGLVLNGQRNIQVRLRFNHGANKIVVDVQDSVFIEEFSGFHEGKDLFGFVLNTNLLRDGAHTLNVVKVWGSSSEKTLATLEFTVDNCPDDVEDRVGDGVDQNCDLVDGVDADGDGFASRDSGGSDCDDTSIRVGKCNFEEGQPEEFVFDVPATLITQVRVESTETSEGCTNGPLSEVYDCDRSDVITVDFGELFGFLFRQIDVDMNTYVQEQIELGEMQIGLTWTPLEEEGTAMVSAFDLVDLDDNLETRDYLASRSNFPEGSKNPRSYMFVEHDGEDFASTSSGYLEVPFFFGGIPLPIRMHSVYIQGKLNETDDGIQIYDTTAAGVVYPDEIYEALNGYVADSCSCLGLGDRDLISIADDAQDSCVDVSTFGCEQESVCVLIGAGCPIVLSLVNGSVGVGFDEGFGDDAIGAYIRLEGESARVLGLDNAP